MHRTAMENGKRFFDTYVEPSASTLIVDIGAQDVNGSLREVAPPECRYVGVDFVEGNGVDVIITDPYALPIEDESVDVCVTSSCFEHSEFFWLLFLEVMRILKPTGLLYINVPSNGYFHRYPVDCWRFYPDSGVALQNWARRNGLNTLLLESFTSAQGAGVWNDFVAVFVKDQSFAEHYPKRIQSTLKDYSNGWVAGATEFTNFSHRTEDQLNFSSRVKGRLRDMFFGGPQ